jgi:predicted enzyme related to lactoylglutathione lyase
VKKLLLTVWMLFCSQLFYTPLYAEQYAESFAITDEPSKLKFPGKFVWADLLTTDLTAASEFYQSVFGWQASTLSDDYILLSNNGRRLAGIVRNKFQLEEDERNQWISFVSTVDINKAHAKLLNAGAEVAVGPVAVTGRGDIGVYVAPDSAVFGIIDSATGDPAEVPAGLNDWVWIELWSINTKAAAQFYKTLGYDVVDNWNSDNDKDLILASDKIARAGLVEGHKSQVKSIWLAYILVDSVDEALSRSEKAGGKTHVLEGEAYNYGKVALVSDPTGGMVAVYELAHQTGGQTSE